MAPMVQPATMEMPTAEPQHMQCVTCCAYGIRDHGKGEAGAITVLVTALKTTPQMAPMVQPATVEMPTVEPQHMQCLTCSAYGERDHGEGDRVKYDAADGADGSAGNV